MDGLSIPNEIRIAIKQGDVQRVKDLISNNEGIINMVTPFGTWLHMAASHDELGIVRLLVNMGADLNLKSGVFGGTALNEAANEGHFDVVNYLISCGTTLDTSEPERNPLFSAILSGSKDIVRLLLDSEIDASVRYTGKYMKNMDAYDFAIERGQKEIAEMLKPYRK